MCKLNNKNFVQWLIGTTMFFIIIVIVAAVFTGIAYSNANFPLTSKSYKSSGQLQGFPHGHSLDGSGAPMAMTLPADLTDYTGKEYSVCSTTDQPHTITIETVAFGVQTYWNNGLVQGTVVTFGGSIGDCVLFKVVDKGHITILSAVNVLVSP